ncbi:MAG: radical SAM protein [Planctomycetota bacterium]
MTTLRISEIYPSIQGESTHAGRPCVFVRLTGCPLRCVWCDTTYAFSGGETLSIDEIVSRSQTHGLDTVEVTGGEPLAQKGTAELLARLAESFATVLLETSGAFSIRELDPRVHVILDLKAPGSGELERNDWDNIGALQENDEVKIVLADRSDYEWARQLVTDGRLPLQLPIHFSPVHGALTPDTLASWLVEDRLPVRLQLQQHKYIWDPNAKGV